MTLFNIYSHVAIRSQWSLETLWSCSWYHLDNLYVHPMFSVTTATLLWKTRLLTVSRVFLLSCTTFTRRLIAAWRLESGRNVICTVLDYDISASTRWSTDNLMIYCTCEMSLLLGSTFNNEVHVTLSFQVYIQFSTSIYNRKNNNTSPNTPA